MIDPTGSGGLEKFFANQDISSVRHGLLRPDRGGISSLAFQPPCADHRRAPFVPHSQCARANVGR